MDVVTVSYGKPDGGETVRCNSVVEGSTICLHSTIYIDREAHTKDKAWDAGICRLDKYSELMYLFLRESDRGQGIGSFAHTGSFATCIPAAEPFRTETVYSLIRTIIDTCNRLRGAVAVLSLRMRGAKVGKGVRIGRRVHFELGRGATLEIGDNVVIDTNCFVTVADGASLHIGHDTFIFHNSDISSASSTRIGGHCSLAPYVSLIDSDHNYRDKTVPIRFQGGEAESIVIEDEVWVATRSVVLKGVRIGKHSVVAAGSVVRKDVPPYTVVAGSPAKVIHKF